MTSCEIFSGFWYRLALRIGTACVCLQVFGLPPKVVVAYTGNYGPAWQSPFHRRCRPSSFHNRGLVSDGHHKNEQKSLIITRIFQPKELHIWCFLGRTSERPCATLYFSEFDGDLLDDSEDDEIHHDPSMAFDGPVQNLMTGELDRKIDTLKNKQQIPSQFSSLLEEKTNDDDPLDRKSYSAPTSQKQQRTFDAAKLKKKRFLMIKDVTDLLQKQGGDLHHDYDPLHTVAVAEKVVRRMKRLADLVQDGDVRPTLQAYNVWIHALAKSGLPNAGPLAESVLQDMKIDGLVPNMISYSSVMDAYAQQSKKHQDLEAAAQAERVLFAVLAESEQTSSPAAATWSSSRLSVTSVVCDTVLNAWAQQGRWEGAVRAEQILKRLENMSQDPVVQRFHPEIRPTVHSYATVIHGWATSGGGGRAAARAQALLERLLRQAAKDGSHPDRATTLLPDTVIFNSVIHAWANSDDPQAGSKAMGILTQMKRLDMEEGYPCAPDIVTYNSVLSAWSHSGHVHSALRAERLLRDMVSHHRQDPERAPVPNTVSYNSVLHAWSKSQAEAAAYRAEKILNFMIESQQPEIAPDVYSFTSVLDTIAKSKATGKANRARSLLDRLLDLHASTMDPALKPSQVPFNTVLNAAAFSAIGTTLEEQRSALQVAVKTFSLMRMHGIPPDTVSYGNLLKCFANLMPPGTIRVDMALQVFEKCCEEGLVGELVWNEVRRAVPHRRLNRQLGLADTVESMTLRDLPRKWCKNLPRKERVTRKVNQSPKETAREREIGIETPSRDQKQAMTLPRFRSISEPSYQSSRDA